jgi:hypothetical protein
LSVTLFAPEVEGLPRLAWLAEIGAIGRMEGVELRVSGGPDVQLGEVAEELRRRRDVMIWSGHGQPGALLMPAGKQVRSRWLATQVHCGMPKLLVLAACGSLAKDEHLKSLAAEVAKVGVNVVGFPTRTDDMAAATYNVELIRAMVAKASVGQATDVALEAIMEMHPETAREVFLIPGLMNGYRDVVIRLEALELGQQMLTERFDLMLDHMGITPPQVLQASR